MEEKTNQNPVVGNTVPVIENRQTFLLTKLL